MAGTNGMPAALLRAQAIEAEEALQGKASGVAQPSSAQGLKTPESWEQSPPPGADPAAERQPPPAGKLTAAESATCDGKAETDRLAEVESIANGHDTQAAVFKRTLPQDTEAERSLLGAILTEPALIDAIGQIITPGDFYYPSHREIFKAMQRLAAAGRLAESPEHPIDLTSLLHELKQKNLLEMTGGLRYLNQIEQATPGTLHAEHWAAIVKECASKRDVIRDAYALMERAYNGTGALELYDQARRIAPLVTGVAKALPRPQRPSGWFEEEEARFANTTFLWDGILEAGGISIITGKKGNGKSTFTRSLGLAIARGDPIFDRSTERSRIWYLDLEPGGRGRIEIWRNLGLTDSDGLDLQTIPPVAGREGVFDWLRDNITTMGYRIVVIDTMFKLLRIDGANEYDKGLYAQVPLEEICRDTGVHFILIHHARKNAISEAQSVAEVILGATSLAGAACACMLINRRRDKFTFRMDPPRYGTAIEGEIVLDLDSSGSIVPGGSWKGAWAKASKGAVNDIAQRETDWFTARELDVTDLETGEKMKLRTVQWALNALFDDGKIDRRRRPSKGTGKPPFEYHAKAVSEGGSGWIEGRNG